MAKVFNKSTIEVVECFEEKGIKHCKFKIDFVALNEYNIVVHKEPIFFTVSEGLIIEGVSPSLEIEEWRHFIGTIADAKQRLYAGFKESELEKKEPVIWGSRSKKPGAEVLWQDESYSLERYVGNSGKKLHVLIGKTIEDYPVFVKTETRVIYEHADLIPDNIKDNVKKAFKEDAQF